MHLLRNSSILVLYTPLTVLPDHLKPNAVLGKVLADANTVESYKIEEKGFIVCMISKASCSCFQRLTVAFLTTT